MAEKFGGPDSGVAAKASPLSACSEFSPLKVASETSASGIVWPLVKVPTTRFWLSTETDWSWPEAKPFCCSWLTCAVVLEEANCVSPLLPNWT